MGVKVRQKTKGKGQPWWVFVSHNGKRTSRKVGSKTTAKDVAEKIQAKIKLGEFSFEEEKPEKPIPTFKEYADLWMKSDVPALCKKSTLENYRGFLNKQILPVFGNLKVTEINRGKVKTFLLEKVGSGYSKSYATQLKNVISGVLNKAVDDEVIQANPALQLGKNFLKVKDQKETINTLTSEELKQLLDIVERHFSGDYPLFLLLARTGLRIGEALALRWDDIDFNDRSIEVCRNFYRNRITKPKNGKTRLVDMSLQLTKTLKAHELSCKKKGLALGIGDTPEYVFTNKYGRLINLYQWRKYVFYKVIKKSVIKKIRIHDLRHTYATLRISKGDNVADVSKQLGHHSVKFTMDTYYHWMPGKKKSEVDGLDYPMHPNAPYMHPITANHI
jgi:integrase